MTQTKDVRGDDIFDSRDALARRDELKEEWQTLAVELAELREAAAEAAATDGLGDMPDVDVHNATVALQDWEEENSDELADLEAFIEEAGDYGDFQYGETCIRDSYFETYAQELADELGVLKDANTWPLTCIDWKRAARELKYDYSSAELAGVTYWFRS